MAEPQPTPERKNQSELKARIEVLEKTVKALLEAFKDMESSTGDEYMSVGEYYGVKFE